MIDAGIVQPAERDDRRQPRPRPMERDSGKPAEDDRVRG